MKHGDIVIRKPNELLPTSYVSDIPGNDIFYAGNIDDHGYMTLTKCLTGEIVWGRWHSSSFFNLTELKRWVDLIKE